MKKIIFSLAIILAISAVVIGMTTAYFNDTETSAGNVFVAGALDLKVDHVKQTYNDADCKTCSVTVVSDLTNMVIEKNEVSITPYPAVYAWVHPAWTAQNDPLLDAAGAEWIWEANPTQAADTLNDVTYTFEKDFEWWGPIVDTDLYMAVGSDNSVWVYLNGVLIGSNTGEFGYLQGSMLQIDSEDITDNIAQGDNVLKFVVKNWALANSTYQTNPAGLIYKFSIDGNCGDDYFKSHCNLWGEKDLTTNDHFWMFDDVKSGDYGTNVISLHLYDNPGWVCLNIDNQEDWENECNEPENDVPDTTCGSSVGEGELSTYLEIFTWADNNFNGVYEPSSGEVAFTPTPVTFANYISSGYDSMTGSAVDPEDGLSYIGLSWCAGSMTVETNGSFTCDPAGMGNITQTDSLTADVILITEQARHQDEFTCVPEVEDAFVEQHGFID